MKNYVINGGGMVGAAAALALAEHGHQVTVIDAQSAPEASVDWDLRISSINQHHWQWLDRLGVGQVIDANKVKPYQALSVAVQGDDGLSFSAAEASLEQLGMMVENNSLQRALWRLMDQQPAIELRAPAKVKRFSLSEHYLELTDGECLHYDVLIGADGAHSAVARAAGITYRGWDYGQRCLLAIVQLQQPVSAETWEVFRPQGPYALLPLSNNQACLIDYRSGKEITHLSRDRSSLKNALNQTFAEHIGDFELLRYASFPLQRKHALHYTHDNSVVLMGDAAHTIHPLAGQGVNLGFADVRGWLSCGEQCLPYERLRQRENQRMMRAMDAIHWGFRSQNPLLKLGLKGIFKGLDQAWLKKRIIAVAMQQT